MFIIFELSFRQISTIIRKLTDIKNKYEEQKSIDSYLDRYELQKND